MFKNKTHRIIFFAVILVAGWSYFAGLSIDVTRDAGKYATVSKEIFQKGNFINLTIHGDAYDQKPPMLFWLGALGFTIGGISNFWFKLPILLLVFAGFYWAFQLGKSLYNKRVGYLTAIFLAFSFIYSMYIMDIHTDTPLQAFVTLALWQLSEFVKTKNNKNWILGFIAIGLAMLCKGPIGAAIPAFAVVGHILLKKEFRFLFDFRWYLGIILAFVVVSPALIGLMNQFGWEGIRFFFWDNNVGRITGSYVQANNDPFFYVHNLMYLFLPWSLLFIVATFSEFRFLVLNKFRSSEFFTLTGIWIYFIILNSASSQLPNYIFSIVPLIAVLTAKWIDIAYEQKQKLFNIICIIQYSFVFVLWLAIFVIVFYLFPLPELYYLIFVLAGFVITIFIFIDSNKSLVRIIIPSAIVLTCLTLILNTQVFPYIFSFQAPPKAARYYNENANENDYLYNYKYGQYELFFYSNPQASLLHNDNEMKEVAGKAGSWIFTNPDGMEALNALNLQTDTIIKYRHLYLNRPAKFINPATREEALQPMYLIKY